MEAQFSLGVLYRVSDGALIDNIESVKWYLIALEQGYANAQYNLGVMCAHGDGVEKRNVDAAQLYFKAAEQGYALALNNIGLMHALGDCVPKDMVQAHVSSNLAWDQDDESAKKNLLIY